MQLLYTGASIFQGTQNDPNLSLGGYISGSVVPNNQSNNIFSDISYQAAQQKRIEVRGLILQNILGVDVADVIFGYQYPVNPNFKIEVAFVMINTSTPTQIEKISNSQSSPYFATFEEANIDPNAIPPIDNSIDIGSLANQAMIAIWLRRTILGPFSAPVFTDVPTQMAYWQALSAPNLDTAKLTNFQIKYTVNT